MTSKIVVNNIEADSGISTVAFNDQIRVGSATTIHSTGIDLGSGNITSHNINSTGIITAASGSFSGNVSIGGTLTYEDVTYVDSVGIITAQSGINVSGGNLVVGGGATISSAGAITAAGKLTVGAGLAQGGKPIEVNTLDGFDRFVVSGGGTVTATGDLIAAGALLRSTSTSDGPVLQFDGAGPNGTNYIFGKIEGDNTGSNNTGELRFYTNLASAGGLKQRMVIARDGDVGIGTDNPNYRLVVAEQDNAVMIREGAGTLAGMTTNTSQKLWFQGGNAELGLFKDGNGSYEYILGTWQSSTPIPLVFRTGNRAERMRITSAGQLLVNTTTSRSFSDNSGNGPVPAIQIEATNSSAIMSIVAASTADSHRAGTINLGRHRNTTVGETPTVVNDGDTLGAVCFSGGDGSDMLSVAAHIRGLVDGTPGNNDMPGALSFSTTPDGASSPYNQERMRITSSGRVGVGKNNPATQLDVAEHAQFSNVYNGKIEGSTNNNSGLILLHKLGQNQGFYFAGDIIVMSWTGQAKIDCILSAKYNNDQLGWNIRDAGNGGNNMVSKSTVKYGTVTYDGGTWVCIKKDGGGTGVVRLNGFISSNASQNLANGHQTLEITSGYSSFSSSVTLN